MDLGALFAALLMGIVEGLTEFLPISSTGHLILLGELIGFRGPPGKTFEISIQLGAILAVVVIYRRLILDLLVHMWRPGLQRYYVVNLVLAFLPAAVIGATLHATITGLLFNPWVVCTALILGGAAIIAIERARPEPSIRSVPEIGPLAAVLIGCGQALAMVPGTSRSGATIIGGLVFGLSRTAATEFSFFLAIPVMFAATGFDLAKNLGELNAEYAVVLAIGFVASFITAVLAVKTFIRFVSRHDFTVFAWYRILFGALCLWYYWPRGS